MCICDSLYGEIYLPYHLPLNLIVFYESLIKKQLRCPTAQRPASAV